MLSRYFMRKRMPCLRRRRNAAAAAAVAGKASILTVLLLLCHVGRINALRSASFAGNRLPLHVRTVHVGLGHCRDGAAISSGAWTMRDASASYWFRVGDSVRVCESVVKSGVDLRGRVGIVQETWEKCDVDPTCCCAEQVDCNMAVRVEFPGALDSGSDLLDPSSTFSHFFGEEELVKVTDPSSESKNQPMRVESPSSDSIAFDGMGCASFKLEALQIESKTRKIPPL